MAAPSIDDRAVPIAVYNPATGQVEVVTLGTSAQESEVTDNTGVFIYDGYAPFGTATSASAWKIFRTPISGTVIGPTQRADGNSNYDNVWDNRASLSYS